MEVGLVIYGSLETLTGGYLYDRKLVDYLRRQGDQVQVFSMPRRSYLRHLTDNLSFRWVKRLAQAPLDLLLEDELNHPSLFLLNRRLRRQASYPVLSIVHHLRSQEKWPVPSRALYRTVENAYLRSVDAFIFNSRTTRHSVETATGCPTTGLVAYPGGDRLGRPLHSKDIIARARRGGPLKLVFVGNVIPRKGLDGLLSVLNALRNGAWELSVAGSLETDTDYVTTVRRAIVAFGLKDRVRLLGPLPAQELSRLLKRSDVLAMPLSYEGFGIAYLEGMAHGLPALASRVGGASEVVTDGESGYLFDPGDLKGPAAVLHRLINDREELLRASLAALRRFEEFPTWEQSARKIRSFLSNAVGVSKSSRS